MVLSSRKNRIYDSVKKIYLCQEGCQFSKFDTDTSKAECNCNVQTNETETDVSKISFGKSEFFDNFYSTLFNSNFRVLKCVKLMFSLKGIKSNYGFYIMTFLLVSFIAFVIVHLIVGQTRIINIINNILKSKGINENNDNNNNYNNNQTENKEPETENKIKREIDIQNNMDRPETKDDLNADIKIEDLQAPVRRRNQKIYKPKKTQFETKKDIVIYNTTDEINDKIEEKENKKEEDKNAEKVTQKASNDKKEDAIEQYKDLTDEEKNELDYEVAIIVDKRTFWQYYISLLKREHLIIFTFIIADDYNLRQIKILLFIVSFALFFAINAFFFGDDTMDKIYEDNGIFNLAYQINQIIYSTIISIIITQIVKFLSLTEKNVIKMKNEKIDNLDVVIQAFLKCLMIKFILFYSISFIFLFLFWYYLSCFCAVYKNTQIYLIKDTLISFGLSLVYPLFINLIPGIFRISSLKKKNKKILYQISKVIQII